MGTASFHPTAQDAPSSSHVQATPEAVAAEISAQKGEPCYRCDYTPSCQLERLVICYPRKLTDEQWPRLRAIFPHKIRTELHRRAVNCSKVSPYLDAFYAEGHVITGIMWSVSTEDSDTHLAAHCP